MNKKFVVYQWSDRHLFYPLDSENPYYSAITSALRSLRDNREIRNFKLEIIYDNN